MDAETIAWQPGQRAVINRRDIVTIDRVTPSGRAKVGERVFGVGGLEIGPTSSQYSRSRLEHLTPEIEAEMALVHRGQDASRDASSEISRAESWLRSALSSFNRRVFDLAAVEKAERLAVAIKQVMEVGP